MKSEVNQWISALDSRKYTPPFGPSSFIQEVDSIFFQHIAFRIFMEEVKQILLYARCCVRV